MLLSELKLNKKNPRKISQAQFEKLKESIKRDPEFMVLRPIIFDSSDKNKILGGNMRFKACQELGMEEIPDDWVEDGKDLSPEQKKRFILVDNAPDGMSGEWETSILLDEWELPELEDLGFDIDSLGCDIDVMESNGGIGGRSYGDIASSSKVPVNILGIGGFVERSLMEDVKKKLISAGAEIDKDNCALVSEIYAGYIKT